MSGATSSFTVHEESFKDILGSTPKLECLLENQVYPFAHEAGVFIPEDNTMFITSNQFPDPLNGEKNIQISKVTFAGGSVTCEKIQTEHVPMANGGVNYQSGILFCA
jgi:gluconolactonase